MVALVVLGLSFSVFVFFGAWLSKIAIENVGRGHQEALQVNKEIRYLLTARVTTLENRLQSSNWQEFATLQQVPAETEKYGWSQQVEDEVSREGLYTEEQLAHLRNIIERGTNSEEPDYPDDLEGSTIG